MGDGDLEVSSFATFGGIGANRFNVLIKDFLPGDTTDVLIHKTIDKGNVSNYDITIITNDNKLTVASYRCSIFTFDVDTDSPLVNFPFGTTIGLPIRKIQTFRIKNKGNITTYTIIVVHGV